MKIPKRLWILLGVAAVSALAYSTTIMFSFNGGDSPYTDDTGEFQLALTLWGTSHPTGYPLYLFLGSPFVNLLRLFGVPPALGASLFSMMWTLVAVVGVAMIVWRLTQKHQDTKTQDLFIVHSSFFIALVFALTRSIWIHASIAEVYALNMAFEVVIIWLTLDLMEKWDDKRGWLLAFVAGLGVAHHRLIAVGLPVVGFMLLPMALGNRGNEGKKGNATLSLISFIPLISFFLLGFLPYIDIMRRIAGDSTWIYGKTDSWEKVLSILIATEYSGLQKPNFDLATLWQNFLDVVNVLGSEMTWVGFIIATLGTVVAVVLPHPLAPSPDDKNQRRHQERGKECEGFSPPLPNMWFSFRERGSGGEVKLFLGIALSYLLFTILLRKAVMIEANLMFVSLALLLGLAVGLGAISSQQSAISKFIVHCSLFILSLSLFIIHRDSVLALTRNPQSIDYVSQIEKIEAPTGSYIMAPWGWRYFGLSYANRIEGRLNGFTIIDHNADYGELAKKTDSIYTAYDTFFIFTENDFWRSRWGQVYLSSAGPNIVRISRSPILRDASTSFIPFGDGIGLINAEVRPTDKDGITDVVLLWTATAKPSRDYSTFVHFSDQDQINSDEDIILKHDQAAPVYAWRATTTWTPNEVIREDHPVKLPSDRVAKLIVVGMYSRNDKGEFVNLKKVEVRLKEGKWVVEK